MQVQLLSGGPYYEGFTRMKFCDRVCKYAETAKVEALDGYGSCRTFDVLYCSKKKCHVIKNIVCELKEIRE